MRSGASWVPGYIDASAIYLNAQSGGNVGIGTVTPSVQLHIARTATPAPAIRLQTTDSTTNGSIQWSNSTNSILALIGSNSNISDSSGNLEFMTGGLTTRMVINSGGNIGISTNNPLYKLDVRGESYINNGANTGLHIDTTVADNNTRDAIYLFEDDGQASGRQAISWYNGNNLYYKARMWTQVGSSYLATTFGIDVADDTRTVDTRLAIRNGNVGIGNITPAAKLQVSGDIRATLSNVNQANFVAYNSSTGLFTYASTSSIVIGTATNADNVFINEDSTDADQPVLFAENTADYYPVRGNKPQLNFNPSTGTLTAVAYVETSALRFKENIVHLTGSLHQVEQLQGVSYNRIGQTRKEIGFIADEVVKILPELVKYQDGEVYGLSYNRVTAVLVEAVKELSDKVNQQEIFIQDLADRLKKLEDKG
jgi:hypothetical protein